MTNDYSCSRATAVWRRGGENVYFREFLNFVVYKNTCKLCFRAPLSAVIASIDAPMHPLQRCTRPTAIRGISIFSTFWGRALSALRSPSYILLLLSQTKTVTARISVLARVSKFALLPIPTVKDPLNTMPHKLRVEG